jgi:hypothetical protein
MSNGYYRQETQAFTDESYAGTGIYLYQSIHSKRTPYSSPYLFYT